MVVLVFLEFCQACISSNDRNSVDPISVVEILQKLQVTFISYSFHFMKKILFITSLLFLFPFLEVSAQSDTQALKEKLSLDVAEKCTPYVWDFLHLFEQGERVVEWKYVNMAAADLKLIADKLIFDGAIWLVECTYTINDALLQLNFSQTNDIRWIIYDTAFKYHLMVSDLKKTEKILNTFDIQTHYYGKLYIIKSDIERNKKNVINTVQRRKAARYTLIKDLANKDFLKEENFYNNLVKLAEKLNIANVLTQWIDTATIREQEYQRIVSNAKEALSYDFRRYSVDELKAFKAELMKIDGLYYVSLTNWKLMRFNKQQIKSKFINRIDWYIKKASH